MGKIGLGEKARSWVILIVSLFISVFSCAQEQNTQQHPNSPEPPSSQTSQNPSGGTAGDKTGSSGIAAETRKVTVGAANATSRLGEKALVSARDWESGWFTGVFVPKDQPRTALTGEQRGEYYLEQTLATPGAYMKRMFAAGIDQARGSPPQWQGGIGGYGERFASREGQFISANSLAALGNAALKYEVRYDQCQCSGFLRRTRHAVVRNFLTYNASEEEMRPQWGLYGGSFGGGMISTAWKPRPRNAFAEGGRAMLGQATYGTLLNFFIEFAGDINRKIGAKARETRRY